MEGSFSGIFHFSGVAEKRLNDAASRGDTNSLQELHVEDPLLLNRVSFTCPNKTPLHLATIHRHLPFVEAILNINPQLAEELDSQQSSPLHIASAKGYVEIVSKLLLAARDMCLSRDCQGRNPLHLAAVKGHVQVLEEIIRIVPSASREKVGQHDTVLHLCVKHDQLEALRILAPNLDELLDDENGDGDTILHMAVRARQSEIVRYLVGTANMDVNTKNSKGQTPMDILQQNPNHPRNLEIINILKSRLQNSNTTRTTQTKSLTQTRDSIMVVAVLIATMAFQAGVTPPGGVWQDDVTEDTLGNPLLSPKWAGESVMARRRPIAYKNFIYSNTIAFVSAIATILLLINGLKGRAFMGILRVFMSLTLTAITATYAIAILVVTPKRHWKSITDKIEHGVGLALWCGVMGIVVVGNLVRFVYRRRKNK